MNKESLRKGLLRGADVVGQATRGARVLPDLLICGGQRCGTTSMYKALVQQPTVFRPVWRKGVHYFDVGRDHDLSWYRAHFPLQAQLNLAAKRHQTRAISFESSPYYLFHPLAADRIAAELPDVKLVVLVRDPVERAYSAHAHEFARGFETLGFEAALDAEAERLDGEEEKLRADPTYRSHAHRHQAYRQRGEYAVQLERITGLFGRDRIKVVDSHRFFSEPEEQFGEVMSWLGIRPSVADRLRAAQRQAPTPDGGVAAEPARGALRTSRPRPGAVAGPDTVVAGLSVDGE